MEKLTFGYTVIEWDLVQDRMSNVFARVYLNKSEAEKQAEELKKEFSWLDYRIGAMVIK